MGYGKVYNGLFPVFPRLPAGISLGNGCRNRGDVSAYEVNFKSFLFDFYGSLYFLPLCSAHTMQDRGENALKM